MEKAFTLLITILFFSTTLLQAQGLEQIIVEKYYVSNEADKAVDDDGGVLPVGSKTYRVYVDMLPDYIFQAAYGETGHELRIATTTRFFNNEDRGETFPSFGENRLDDNTVMLDSWLSVGGACDDCIGVLKSEDDGVNTIVNGDGVLMNADTCAGIPLTQEDGHVAGSPEPVTTVGISSDIEIFNSSNDSPIPTIFSTTNGAWSSLNGSSGANPTENKVLIGQFTTDGDFSFELNIQIRNEATMVVERYVARNPLNTESLDSTLIFTDTMAIDTMPTDSMPTSVVYLEGIDEQINIFPNPAQDELSLEIQDGILREGTYEIFSTTGRRVLTGAINPLSFQNQLSKLDIRSLSHGVYVLKVKLGKKIYTKKFLKIIN